MLLDKMMNIERKKTQLNPLKITQKSFHAVKTLNAGQRTKDLSKINKENKVHIFYIFMSFLYWSSLYNT